MHSTSALLKMSHFPQSCLLWLVFCCLIWIFYQWWNWWVFERWWGLFGFHRNQSEMFSFANISAALSFLAAVLVPVYVILYGVFYFGFDFFFFFLLKSEVTAVMILEKRWNHCSCRKLHKSYRRWLWVFWIDVAIFFFAVGEKWGNHDSSWPLLHF